MAKGYPDFFGHSVFPQLGSFINESEGPDVIANGDTHDVFSISGKGCVYDGYHRIYLCTDFSLTSVRLTIDGVASQWAALDTLLEYRFTQEGEYIYTLQQYCPEDQQAIIAIRDEITFATDFKSEIRNLTGFNISAVSVFYYAKVT